MERKLFDMHNLTMWQAIDLHEWKKLSKTDKALHKLQESDLYKSVIAIKEEGPLPVYVK